MGNPAAILDEIATPIAQVPAPAISLAIMERVIPLLERVVEPWTGHTIDHVVNELLHGETQLWVIGDFQAVTITEIQVRPTQKVLWNSWIAGDHIQEWVDDWLKVQEAFARANGCSAVEFAGRKGYERAIMPQHQEFRAMRTLYRQELT